MFNNISIELLKTFTEEELQKFGEYINSPFFNKRKELVKLYDIIINCRPDYAAPVLKRENLFKKLYPKSKYNEQTLKTRMAELTSLLRGFLSVNHLQKNSLLQKRFQANELMRKQKYSMSEKILREILETIENEKIRDAKYFEDKYFLITDLCETLSAEENYKEKLNSEVAKAESLINFFLIELLNNASSIISLNLHNKNANESSLQSEFLKRLSISSYLDYLKEIGNEHHAIIAIYYYAYLTRKENNSEEHFYNLKNYIYKEYRGFSKKEQFNFWNFLSNAAYPNLVNKDKKFYREKHDIDMFFSALDVFNTIDGKYIYIQTFNNIYNAALLVNEFDWAEKFIKDNKDRLLPEFRENTFNYCMATLSFKRKEFEKSITYLSKVHFRELTYNLDVRVCYIMNYYELNLYDQLTASIDAFKHFITENKNFPENRVDWANTSLRFIAKISNAKFGAKKLDYADYKEAEKVQSYMSRRWVLEKMKELL